MLPYLQGEGVEAKILYEPASPTETPDLGEVPEIARRERIDIVYFQKVRGESALRAARDLRRLGIRTVFGVCDIVDLGMAEACDATVVVTEFLKGLYPGVLQQKISVVHDGIEHPEIRKGLPDYRDHRASPLHRMLGVLVTSSELDTLPVLRRPPPFMDVSVVGNFPRRSLAQRLIRSRWQIAAASSAKERWLVLAAMGAQRFRKVDWSVTATYDWLVRADVGIIPVATEPAIDHAKAPLWAVKSENRLTLKMAVGLPVVASPVPAYLDVIEQGVNGYIARTKEEWMQCLMALCDPDLRRQIGQRARESVIERFSKERQAARLLSVLRGLSSMEMKTER